MRYRSAFSASDDGPSAVLLAGARIFRIGICSDKALRAAVTDAYVRRGSKASRNYPRKKNEKPAGKPIVEPASRQQIKDAKELKANEQVNQLTA